MQEQTIYRHWFGTFIIFLAGTIPMSVLFYFMYFVWEPDDPLGQLAAFISIIIGLVTAVLIYTFTLSHIDLNDSGIQYTKYSTLFSSSIVEADWNTVQSIDATKPGIFAQLFGFGTLLVQTADAKPNFSMTYVPQVLQVKELIDQHASVGAAGGA
jgi:uncharacterized membrane protein YdbT with pleckstrin-like domain